MRLEDRINAFVRLGLRIKEIMHSFYDDADSEFQRVLSQALVYNPWFTKENQIMALSSFAEMLDEKKLEKWLSTLSFKVQTLNPKQIGVIMAGNIPAVGFHDFLCVLITGNILKAKCASDDKILLPWFSKLLIETEPRFRDKIFFVYKIENVEAVIATGSNNSARYFEYYFSKYPHIIRKNRNAVAVISGGETEGELTALGKDIFSYFGLGCRNVSKMYLPKGYDINLFFHAVQSFSDVMQHNKYMNNFDYHQALYLLNNEKFLTNNFLIIREDKMIATPVSVLNYEHYNDLQSLKMELENQKEKIQCIVSNHPEIENAIPFGKAQHPELWDYADGIDTIDFLRNLN